MLAVAPAAAQSSAPVSPPKEQALAEKLGAEINTGLVCGAMLISARREIERLQAQNKELETKVAAPENH